MRLEIFRQINQGGTPLSGQDIRLAYYGEKSASLALIRLAGVYDPNREASKRFLERAHEIGLSYPWKNPEVWKDWWEDKAISRGQTASEAFLWSLIVAQVDRLNQVMTNQEALKKLNVGFSSRDSRSSSGMRRSRTACVATRSFSARCVYSIAIAAFNPAQANSATRKTPHQFSRFEGCLDGA